MKSKDRQKLLFLKEIEQSENIKNRIKKINTEFTKYNITEISKRFQGC